jgi:hypothetical protein
VSHSRSFSGPAAAGVELAQGGQSPVWPLPAVTRRSWNFGHSRGGGARRHVGVDLYAPRGSEVLAPEDGVIVASQKFLGPQSVALLLELDSGIVVLLGEVAPRSWDEYGLRIGSRVSAGQPVARVGVAPNGSSMLHFEIYRGGTRANSRWLAGQAPPANVLDPTHYLQRAGALDAGQSDPSIVDDERQAVDADPDADDHDVGPSEIPRDDAVATIPIKPHAQDDRGFFGPLSNLALLFGLLSMWDRRNG